MDKVADYPVMARLFGDAAFLAAARGICPLHRQVLDPFQFNFIIQVGKEEGKG